MDPLDSPDRLPELKSRLGKKALRQFYAETYESYAECLQGCPANGLALELGSGAGFAKEIIPAIVTTDVIPYSGIDRILDASAIDLEAGSVKFIGMVNVLHHISDLTTFFERVDKCLMSGGRLFAREPYPGWISTPIFKYFHHEPFEPEAPDWGFEPGGPLSSANEALPWIVFERDRPLFETRFPRLRVERFQPHSPLCYWLTGGMKRWTLLSEKSYGLARTFDKKLIELSPRWGSFVDIELVKMPSV